jgi:hypothetical protein
LNLQLLACPAVFMAEILGNSALLGKPAVAPYNLLNLKH